MTKVHIYDKDIELNKVICIVLDNTSLQTIFNNTKEFNNSQNVNFCNDYKDLCKTINRRKSFIITPLTNVLSALVMELGYELIVFSNNKCVSFSKLLNGDSTNSFHKEIRTAQNWEKMLYAGCFNLDIPEIKRGDI